MHLFSILLAGLMTMLPVATPPDPLVARTDAGLVRGKESGPTRTFSGIRFAAPPVGEDRWKPPRPPEPWKGVADATKPGNFCPQSTTGAPLTDEDCLFLNVTVPRDAGGRRLPVLVWLHGGGYTRDAGSLYGAQRLADQGGVIVVTTNYRLGVFGYFGHPGLAGSGDFGLADQLSALRWTQHNIASFGGNPGDVTVAGQSAGGMSTCALLTSPAATGLFHKAAIMSGSCLLNWPPGGLIPNQDAQTPYSPLAETEADGKAVATSLGCTGPAAVECLRRLPAADLLPHTQTFANHLTYDTPLLPSDPAKALRHGAYHRVPVISGGTHDEMRSFVAGVAMVKPITEERYQEFLRKAFGEYADEVGAKYPSRDYESPAMAWATVTTDRSWACPTAEADRVMSERGPVYAYEFDDKNAPNVNGVEAPGLPHGAAHALDMAYLFELGGFDLIERPEQKRLSDQMIAYWTAFVRTGDPNTPGSPRWDPYGGRGPVLSLAPDAIRPTDHDVDHRCGFWASVGS
ncbi:carboxylesterase/lipase family protein [Amycolatopsis pittospori]|uniref:carboxylesterase/lipase family protein n=1 Tax=Amycolatopsis pittospori TaxID=2749434 RepID=UPI0015F028C2|nr:carboxylesterase family protein [Amycolatopsis pittospori]